MKWKATRLSFRHREYTRTQLIHPHFTSGFLAVTIAVISPPSHFTQSYCWRVHCLSSNLHFRKVQVTSQGHNIRGEQLRFKNFWVVLPWKPLWFFSCCFLVFLAWQPWSRMWHQVIVLECLSANNLPASRQTALLIWSMRWFICTPWSDRLMCFGLQWM